MPRGVCPDSSPCRLERPNGLSSVARSSESVKGISSYMPTHDSCGDSFQASKYGRVKSTYFSKQDFLDRLLWSKPKPFL